MNDTWDDSLQDLIILVDEQDQQVGVANKLQAHRKSLLHRAFSVLLYRQGKKGTEVLLQRRALQKYHSGGLLANSCCSHPRDGETLDVVVPRRLEEELGVRCDKLSDLREVGSFVYEKRFQNGLCEHEYDHVFVARYEGQLTPDPNEIAELCWMTANEVDFLLKREPQQFAVWFSQVWSFAKTALPA